MRLDAADEVATPCEILGGHCQVTMGAGPTSQGEPLTEDVYLGRK